MLAHAGSFSAADKVDNRYPGKLARQKRGRSCESNRTSIINLHPKKHNVPEEAVNQEGGIFGTENHDLDPPLDEAYLDDDDLFPYTQTYRL